MNLYIILLRGVNVGGNNLLPMKDLKAHLEKAGFEQVKTYIQSGNILLMSTYNPENEILTLVEESFGFAPKVMVLSVNEFNQSVENNPYPDFEGKFVHFYFCNNSPKLNNEKLEKFSSESENYTLVDNVFYLHAPDGIARSKLVANIEACLGVSATGRNMNTVNKLVNMLETT